MSQRSVEQVMRDDWNARASEDANYYVAFGRREQEEEEFFATAVEVLASLDQELRRGIPSEVGERRFLEIGCGPGRLLRPMRERCDEIHGVDVSDQMAARARKNLAGLTNAYAHVGSGSGLDFPDRHFDFVYSYAVFQHIPSREVVFSYLAETLRVLKPGGLARLHINGLPPDAAQPTTWAGVRIAADEIRDFTREHDLQLLALEGLGTQYMWTTWRKQAPRPQMAPARIRRITNAFNTEPVAPVGGRFAALSLWLEGLAGDVDLSTLDVQVAGCAATATYLGAASPDGLCQLNVLLPPGLRDGLAAVEVAGASRAIRLLPEPPAVPRVVSLSDGVDLLSGYRISSGLLKLTVEEFHDMGVAGIVLGGLVVEGFDSFCVDPMPPRHEINVRVPAGLGGKQLLEVLYRTRCVHREFIEICDLRVT